LAIGIGDDAALLRVPKGHQMVVTTDFCLEGVHFRRDWHTSQSAGHRCLARGLSDLAAMGARPQAAFLSLALPQELAGDWADGFFRGLLALAAQYKIPLAGGDLARSPGTAKAAKVLADIVLVGSVPVGTALLRSAARAGDVLYVTGSLGGAAADLVAISSRRRNTGLQQSSGAPHPQLFPEPRIAAGLALRKLGKRIACLDISDGLALDLARLCEASSVAAEVDASALPIAPGASLQQALTGGEDYELLFTAPGNMRIPKKLGGVAITCIGRIVPARRGQPQVTLLQQDGQRSTLEAAGWEYFR
jgi:thiamine-monophosphate kinase